MYDTVLRLAERLNQDNFTEVIVVGIGIGLRYRFPRLPTSTGDSVIVVVDNYVCAGVLMVRVPGALLMMLLMTSMWVLGALNCMLDKVSIA